MATPTIASLALRYPSARVDVCVGRHARPALGAVADGGQGRSPANGGPRFSHQDHVLALPRRGERAGDESASRIIDAETLLGGRPDLPTLLRVAARLRRGQYDLAVVLERSFWLGILPLLAGIPIRVGLDSGGRGRAHTIRVRIAGVRHEADLYLDCVRALGPGPLAPRMGIPIAEADSAAAEAALRAAGWQGESYAVLHPGGGTNPGMRLHSKRWPPERFAALAARLRARGISPIIIAGADEQPLIAAVQATPIASATVTPKPSLATTPKSLALSIGSQLPLPTLAALASNACVYVGNDTGPTHVAAAAGAPTVAIFGPSDERRFVPFGTRDDGTPIGIAVANPPHPPDRDMPAYSDRRVDDVTVDQVWAAIERHQGAP